MTRLRNWWHRKTTLTVASDCLLAHILDRNTPREF